MSAVLSLKPSYYEALKRLTLELAGVHLGDDHAFLVETRLGVLAREEGYQTLNQMVDDLFGQGQTRLAVKVVSSLLERDTHFNPDRKGTEVFETFLLPTLHNAAQGQKLRILSFACSSGQEPYSLAIKALQFQKANPGFSFEILGVDYPSPALARAMEGKYTHFEVQRGLPIRDLIKYFERSGEDWTIGEELRQLVKFQEFHLLSKLDGLGEFDLVVFRNSLAHYSSPAQIRVVRSLSSVVKAERFLMIGSTEKLPATRSNFDVLESFPFILRKHAQPASLELDAEQMVPGFSPTPPTPYENIA